MKRTAGYSSHLMFTSALILGALSAPSLAAQNPSGPELYFYPAKGWSVAKSEAQMCSIASQFNNGFTIRFEGDQKWVQGMQINFAQDIFEPDKDYDISLSIPGVQDTDFRATSRGRDSLRIGLRRDKEFYKALRKSAVLDMNLEGNDFRFYLTGFSKSAGDFENCMAGGEMAEAGESRFMVNETIAMEEQMHGPAAAVVEISPENPQPVVQEIPQKTIHKLGKQTISTSRAGTDEILSTDVEGIVKPTGETKGRQRLSEQLAKQIAEDPSLIDVNMDEQNQQPSPVREALSMPPNMPEMLPAHDEALTPAPIETSAQEEKLVVVETEATPPAETLLKPVEEKEIDVAEASALETPPAEPEHIQSSTPPVKVHKESYSSEADFTEIEPAAAASNIAAQDLRKQVLSLENIVQNLKDENTALTNELQTALRESEEERLSISSENWNLESATMKFNEAERQIKRMGQQLQKERAKCKAEKQELEAMLFDPQVTSDAQLARLAELESQLMKARKELDDQRAHYEERIRSLERRASAE
ncbi:MAG: hypothetical protein H6859_07655 [Rhodospirillales bacterium]|nr:hypothetical protein [Alphaproteobacteria bacterium]USO05026.1 MAG: hypothetical protein H6859_07655 [Rhodospirillales bacterium]